MSIRYPLLSAMLVLTTLGTPLPVRAQTVDKKPEAKAEVLAKMNDLIEKYAFVPGADFSRWPQLVEARKTDIENAKDDESFIRVVNGALREFGFSHIVLATPQMAQRRATGKQVGIGITSQTVDKGLLIIRTVPDAPASIAGLKPGDIVTLVDGNPVEGTKGIPGEDGTTVNLKVLHPNGKTQDYKLVRRAFSIIEPDTLEWIDADTAKLTVHTFDRAYNAAQIEGFMKEAAKGKNLIVDLRNNGGGAVTNLRHLAGLLMPSDKSIGVSVDKSAANAYLKRTKKEGAPLTDVARLTGRKLYPQKNTIPPFAGNVVVFINGGSGSASEILAAALKEQLNAPVIGQKSAGAVLVSVIVPATNGFVLQYPLSDFVTPEYRRLEGAGVSPDIVIEGRGPILPGTQDPAIAKAQAVFERARLRRERGIGA